MEETSAMVATVSRREVEEAARSEEPIDLLLDVQVEQDGRSDTQRLAIAWDTTDLERLLGSTSGDEIQLAFDEEELRMLLDPDVEAHGLREKFAVVTAVAGLAAAAAGPATAAVYGGSEGGTPAAAAQAVTPAEITTGLAPAPETSTAGVASEISTGLGPAEAAPAQAVTASEISTGLTQPAAEATPVRASEISTGLTPSTPSVVSVHVAPGRTVHASEVSTGIAPGPSAVETPGGGGSSIEWPSTAEAIAGGVLLAITAAMFVARTQRRPPLPA